MTQPLISVIIPSYNHADYVCQAVESALVQSYPHLEVIVVDDGSTDDTKERLVPFSNRIRYVHQRNQGLSAARNRGINEAQGEYIAFLDSDDAFHPRKLELQAAYLIAQPDIALVGTGMFSDESIVWCPVNTEQLQVSEIQLEAMAIKPRFAPSSVMAHRRCFQTVGMFDTDLRSVEDRDMWLRIGTQFKMARLDLPLTWYRITPGSMSSHPERMEHFELLVLHRSLEFPQLKGKWTVRRQALSHCYRSSAYTFLAAGRPREAFVRLMQSIRQWPWFYSMDDDIPTLYRCRLMWAVLRRLLRRQSGKVRPDDDCVSATHPLAQVPSRTLSPGS